MKEDINDGLKNKRPCTNCTNLSDGPLHEAVDGICDLGSLHSLLELHSSHSRVMTEPPGDNYDCDCSADDDDDCEVGGYDDYRDHADEV